MKLELRPLPLIVLCLGSAACSELLPEVTETGSDPEASTGSTTTGPGPTTSDTGSTTTDTSEPTTAGPTTSVDTTAGMDTTADTTVGGEESTTGEGSGCMQVMADEVLQQGMFAWWWQTTALDTELGDATDDLFRMSFYDDITGDIDLSADPNDNYETCEQCLQLFEDYVDEETYARRYFQRSGTITIDPASDPEIRSLIVSTAGVILEEVTVDPDTLESTPVPDGACVELVDYASASGGETVLVDPGPPQDILDDGYNGALASMECVPLMVPSDGIDAIYGLSLQIGIDHPYVGDLVIKVESPQGSVTTVLNRPGLAEDADDGASGSGDSSNLEATSPISFFDAAPIDAELMGDTINQNGVVCADDDECEFMPSAGAAIAGTFIDLLGQDSSGPWLVCVGDAEPGDSGSIDFVELTLQQVP